MYFSVTNFRRFFHPSPCYIAPITVLVGENSSGKTSFAAGLRYVLDTISVKGEGSFNKEPFFIGAFDQIAHFRGGKAGRASEFTLSLKVSGKELERLNGSRFHTNFFIPYQNIGECETSLHFANSKSQPVLTKVDFISDRFEIEMQTDDLPAFKIKEPLDTIFTNVKNETDRQNLFFKAVSSTTDRNSLRPFLGALQNWIYLAKYTGKKKDKADSKISNMVEMVSSTAIAANIFSNNIVYSSAPFRTKPERNYSPVEATSTPEGTHIPILLAQAKVFETQKWSHVKATLEQFGTKSGMFKKIDIKRLGNKESDPFQIIIQVSQDRSNLIDVGYGVSQVLPLIVETLINDDSKLFIFQQPEVHLHPRAQAELGTYFVDFTLKSEKFVLLETHSDFMIDRIRTELVSRKLDPNEMLSVLYFKRNAIDTAISRVTYDNQGNVISAPDGFRDFFVHEAMRNLGL